MNAKGHVFFLVILAVAAVASALSAVAAGRGAPAIAGAELRVLVRCGGAHLVAYLAGVVADEERTRLLVLLACVATTLVAAVVLAILAGR